MNLWTALVAIVAIWGIVAIVQHWSRARRIENADGLDQRLDALEKELKERIQTLEKIVTDDRDDLARRFDDLDR